MSGRCLVLVLLAHALLVPCGTAQPRPGWTLDTVSGLLELRAPGVPPVASWWVNGTPWQVRADLAGRAVLPDVSAPVVHLASDLGVATVLLPLPARDAVPDGQGGALALVPGPAAISRVVRVDAFGRSAVILETPGWGYRLRLLTGGEILIAFQGPGTEGEIRRIRLAGGVVLAQRSLPRPPRDIVFDDEGRIVPVGADPAAIRVLDQNLQDVLVVPATWPIVAGMPFAGGGLLVVDGWPSVARIAGAPAAALPPLPVGPAGSVEALPDGGIRLYDPEAGMAMVFTAEAGPVALHTWVTGPAQNDGLGVQHARAVDRERDPDGDGFASGAELARRHDPGDGGDAPLLLDQFQGLLRLRAPALGSAPFVVRASAGPAAGSDPPALALDPVFWFSTIPGLVFDRPSGILDPGGETWIMVSGPALAGLSVAAAVAEGGPAGAILVAPARAILPW